MKHYISICFLILFSLTMLLGIGFASISATDLQLEGTASLNPQEGIFITNATYTSSVAALETDSRIKNYTGTLLESKIELSPTESNSSITYTITVYNRDNFDYYFNDVLYDNLFYDNENIVFHLNGLSPGDIVSSHEEKQFTITFSYKENTTPSSTVNVLNSYLNFSFKANHTVTYQNISNTTGAPVNIGDGLTYTYTFLNPPDRVEVVMGENTLVQDTDYTYNAGVLTIPNVTNNLTITGVKVNIGFDHIMDHIDNNDEIKGDIVENTTYSGISTTNDSGVYSIDDPNTGESDKIYFYRGNVNDNYFSFAGKTWRILRLNSDGTIRLVLDGSAGTSRYQSRNVPTTRTIDGAISLLNWENSTVYSTLNTWYTNNLNSYNDYIIQDSEYVFDTSYIESTSSGGGVSGVYYFGSYIRVGRDGNLYQPTYAYDESSVKTGKIGLMTADEVLYAGGFWGTNNTNYFLYNSSIGTDWWTMSPSFWDKQTHYKAGLLVIGSRGNIHDWPSNGNTLTATLAIRPVITVRGDLELTGNGTSSNPYKFSSLS